MSYETFKRSWAGAGCAALIVLLGTGTARGDDCAALGGALDAVRRACVVSSLAVAQDSAVPDGAFDLDQSLIVDTGGDIVVPPAAGGNHLTIRIAGDLVVQMGASIRGDASGVTAANGIAATLRIAASGNIELGGDGTAGAVVSSSQDSQACALAGSRAGDVALDAGGDVVARPGSVVAVTSKLCKSGNIFIAAGGRIRIDGLIASGPSTVLLQERLTEKVLSGGSRTAGRIEIRSRTRDRPGITVGSAGNIVSQAVNVSRGILLEGCGIEINGLLASLAADRDPDHSNIVLRSTDRITVNGDDLGRPGASQGRIRADGLLADPGGPSERYRIDLFARQDIAVTGPGSGLIFTVTSNPRRTAMSPPSGIIRVISLGGGIDATGKVFEAGREAPAKAGGTVVLEATRAVDLTEATIAVVGDFNRSGVLGAGGTIAVRSFRDRVTWQRGLGDVRPTGDGVDDVTRRGIVSLSGCGQVDVDGTAFPHTPPEGNPTGPDITVSDDCPADAAPSLPPETEPLPICECVVTSECDDDNVCNGTEVCDAQSNSCIDGIPLVCGDDDLCNGVETCVPDIGCQPGTPLACDDEDACNGVETCDALVGCEPGLPLNCEDGNVCTADACGPATGCVHTANTAPCDDGNACTTADRCAATQCVGGPPPDCDDQDVCNGVEACDPVAGCQPGRPLVCDDGDMCNGAETCDPQFGCHVAGCDPETGACADPLPAGGTLCSDGDACNGEEVCQDGACTTPSPEAALSCAGAAFKLFVGNFDDGTVSVLNAPGVPPVSVGRGPWGVAVHPRGTEVYVTNREDNTVSVIDTRTWSVAATVPVGDLPLGVAIDPAGAIVYVASYNDDTITLIDADTHAVIGSMRGGAGPTGLAFNPSGTRLYVTDYAGDAVSVFDTATRKRRATVPVGSQPLGIAVDVVRNCAFVVNFASDDVSVLGLFSDTVLSTVPVGSEPFDVDVFGPLGLAYITNAGENTVSVIDSRSHSVLDTVAVGLGPLGVAFDLTGARGYVVNAEEGTVSAIDSAAQVVTTTEPVGTLPVAFGRFAGSTQDGCGAANPVCDDADPFTLDSCVASVGCVFTPLGGREAARAGIGALVARLDSAPAGTLGNEQQANRLRKLVNTAGKKLDVIDGTRPTKVRSKRALRRRQRRARRSVNRLVTLIERGIRRSTMQRDIAWQLLDVTRRTLTALGKAQPSSAPATVAFARIRPAPPPPGRRGPTNHYAEQ